MTYVAFVDPAGGSGGDSMTLALAHAEERETRTVAVLDLVRERRPPFSPEAVVEEFVRVLHRYDVSTVTGDRYAGTWPAEQFRKRGVEYVPSERSKSEIYRDVLPLLNSGGVELLDLPRLVAQFSGLERRTARGGRDSIDHAPGSHDDVVNASAGALVLAAADANEVPLKLLFTGPEVLPDDDVLPMVARQTLWGLLEPVIVALAAGDEAAFDLAADAVEAHLTAVERHDPDMAFRLRAVVDRVAATAEALDGVA